MINIYTVYIHTNLINGKKYVGITSCKPEVRWRKGYGYSENLPVGRAFRKYGWNSFSHEIVCEGLTESEAKEMEIKLIAELNTQNSKFGYNICSGGDGVTGWHPTEETKKKISDAMKEKCGSKNNNFGHKWTNEMKAAASNRAKNMSQETKDLISRAAKKRVGESNSFYGKRHSDETKKKIAEARCKKVMMLDLDMNVISTFSSMVNASKATGVHKVSISNCCREKTKTAGGYIWKYC